jgi:hypothetical protein
LGYSLETKNIKLFLQSLVFACFSCAFSSVFAEPPVPPFYAAVMQMSPAGKLGQVIKKEEIKTSLKGAQA